MVNGCATCTNVHRYIDLPIIVYVLYNITIMVMYVPNSWDTVVFSHALLSSTNITTINSYNHRPFFIVICIKDIYNKSAPIERLMNRSYSLSQIHSVIMESGEVILGERSDPGLISICFKGCQDFNSWLGLSRPHVVHVYVV